MSNPFLGEIRIMSFNFAPRGWTMCNGSLLPINQNQALFALLGTTYGGNGQTTFALPDLRGRVAPGFGTGPTDPVLGQTGGSETVTLVASQLPAHGHAIDATALTATAMCRNSPANQRSPVAGVPAIEAAGVTATYSSAAPDANMKAGAVPVTMTAAPAGGDQPHANLQPFLCLNYCIALQGVFPSQN